MDEKISWGWFLFHFSGLCVARCYPFPSVSVEIVGRHQHLFHVALALLCFQSCPTNRSPQSSLLWLSWLGCHCGPGLRLCHAELQVQSQPGDRATHPSLTEASWKSALDFSEAQAERRTCNSFSNSWLWEWVVPVTELFWTQLRRHFYWLQLSNWAFGNSLFQLCQVCHIPWTTRSGRNTPSSCYVSFEIVTF